MRRFIAHAAITLCGATFALPCAWAEEITSASRQWAIAQKLIDNERDAWRNYARRDLEASARLLADDYRDLQPDGTVADRAGHLAFVPAANLEWHELDQFRVFMLAPDAALVTYRARARDHGAKDEYRAAVTSGWAQRDKRWLNTFYRETPTVPEVPPAASASKP